jgi:hypothetical protein
MCRSIKVLRRPDEPATPDEVSQAALQFVRKISGYNKPSKANQDAFEKAVREIAEVSQRLLGRSKRQEALKTTASVSRWMCASLHHHS